jgi:tetratricopeptide (TPR) repeat protein
VMLARARLWVAEYAGGPDPRAQMEQSHTEASTLIDRALALDPQLSEGYVERANLRVYEDPQAAEKDYRNAIELAPSNARAYQQLGTMLWDDPARREEVAALLDRARTLNPLDPEYDVTMSLYLYYDLGKAEEADLLLRRVLERSPDYLPAMDRRGELLMYGLGRTVDAIRLFEAVLALDPELDTPRRFLVAAYVRIGDLEQARRIAEHPQASPVCRLFVANAEHHVEEAARLAYAAFRDNIVGGADQQIAVEAIILGARRSKDHAKAASVLEDVLNIVWISETEPVLGPNRGTVADVVSYVGMLREAGDELKAKALLDEVERSIVEEDAKRGRVDSWNNLARLRAVALKGDKAATLSMLEQTCAGPKSLCEGPLETDPMFEPFRKEPRFKALVEILKRNQEAARKELRSG